MPRPFSITPEVAAQIDAIRASMPGLPLRPLSRTLAASGIRISPSTLGRHLRGEYTPEPAPPPPAPADTTPAGLAEELRRRYVEVRAVVDRVRNEATLGGPALSRWLGAVRELGELAERLERMVPPAPPDPEQDPAHAGAKARLLAEVDRVLARGT